MKFDFIGKNLASSFEENAVWDDSCKRHYDFLNSNFSSLCRQFKPFIGTTSETIRLRLLN